MKWVDVSSGQLGPVGLPMALQRYLELVLYRIAFMCVRLPSCTLAVYMWEHAIQDSTVTR